jgi:hypothetical protein
MGEFQQEFDQHLNDHESALAFAKSLRNVADHSRRKFFEFLMAIESRPGLWNMFGATFSTYLAKCHLCQAGVYEDFKKGMATIPVETVDAIGFHGTRAIARVSPDNVAACAAKMRETVRNEGGVPLSRFRAETLAAEFAPPKPQVAEPTVSYAQLQKENERLKRKVTRLEAQKVALEAKLAAKATKKRERRSGDEASPN